MRNPLSRIFAGVLNWCGLGKDIESMPVEARIRSMGFCDTGTKFGDLTFLAPHYRLSLDFTHPQTIGDGAEAVIAADELDAGVVSGLKPGAVITVTGYPTEDGQRWGAVTATL